MARGRTVRGAYTGKPAELSASKPKGSLLSQGVRAVGKVPFGRYKDVTTKINPRFKKGQVLGAQTTGYKGANINDAPKSSKKTQVQKMLKKGLQTNYSR